MEDDYEMIDSPATQVTATDLPIRTKVNSQQLKSLSRPEIETASERSMEPLVAAMQASVDKVSKNAPLFYADLGPDKNLVFNTWREGVPEKDRGILNCTACRHYLRKFGNLCAVNSDGTLQPLFWSPEALDIPPYYRQSFVKIAKLFESKVVTKEFRDVSLLQGKSESPAGWTHMSITLNELPKGRHLYPSGDTDTKTLYTMLNRVLEDNSVDQIAYAHHIIQEEQLPYATEHKAPISYLHEVVKKLADQELNDITRRNLITRYACEAFLGCISSVRGGLLGYLLECIREGQDFGLLLYNWETKAEPLSYLRPTAAPSEGNIRDAEKIFAELGYKPYDLERVYLTLDQVPKNGILWSPKPTAGSVSANSEESSTAPGPIFGKLLKQNANVKDKIDSWANTPVIDISFRKFAERILPNVESMELDVAWQLYIYFFTNGKENSKPLMSFHTETNTASWYVWGGERYSTDASLPKGWTKVNSIVTLPTMWEHISPMDALIDEKAEAFKHKRHDIGYLFCLEGIREIYPAHLCLFPTLMKNEFHGVRKTVEAFSNAGHIEFPPEGKDIVGGVFIAKEHDGDTISVRIKTHTGQKSRYRITLFD